MTFFVLQVKINNITLPLCIRKKLDHLMKHFLVLFCTEAFVVSRIPLPLEVVTSFKGRTLISGVKASYCDYSECYQPLSVINQI